jgi:CheY-like chemotaxis protein
VDLIITDIVMPQKDCLETIMEFHHQSPGLVVITISGGGKVEANEYLPLAEILGAQKTSRNLLNRKFVTRRKEFLRQPWIIRLPGKVSD